MVALDEIYEVEIESVNIFGNGVCHIDSFVVFVSDAIALEKCKIKITKVDRAFAYAKVIERVKISEKRIAPACSVYGRCGGCSFMHMSIDEENQAKLDFVKSTFKKNRVEADFAELSCPVNERYRNKVVLFYGEGGFGYDNLFYYVPLQRSFAELSAEEKNAVSHRRSAIRAFALTLADRLGISPKKQ